MHLNKINPRFLGRPMTLPRMHRRSQGGDLGRTPSPPPSGEGKRKNALKMHENVLNFKNFSPAAPIGTAGGTNLFNHKG